MITEGTKFKVNGIEYTVTCTCRRLPADRRLKVINVCRTLNPEDEGFFILNELKRWKKDGIAYDFK